MATVRLAAVTDAPVDVAAVTALVADDRAGAVVAFQGVVRDHDGGRAVASLDYTAHPTAAATLAEVAAAVAAEHPVHALAVVHRLGSLTIGDVALLAVVAASHRAEAFACVAALVDRVKQEVPVWKHQHLADGTSEWSGCP